MSVEINVGDKIQFDNIMCCMIIHRALTDPSFVLSPNLVGVTIATVISIHKNGDYENGYLIAQGEYYTFLLHLPDLLESTSTLINGAYICKEAYPNKWAEFTDDPNRKVPKSLDDVMYGHTAFPKYDRLIKKYVPLRRKVYLWACNTWRNFTG